MFVSFGAARSGTRQISRQYCLRPLLLAFVVLAVTGLSGCMEATVPFAGPDPANPGLKVRGISYRSTITPYTSLRPVGAAGWKEQNQGAAPKQGKSE